MITSSTAMPAGNAGVTAVVAPVVADPTATTVGTAI
jgi:hypothetical protein